MRNLLTVAAAVLSMGVAGGASAATFVSSGVFSQNECVGQGSFANCTLNGAASVAKFKFDKGVAIGTVLNNTVFPAIDGSEFQVSLDNRRSGAWSYTPGNGDPLTITAFVVKTKGKYSVFTWDPSSGSDLSDILFNTRDMDRNSLKYVSFYSGNNISPVPLPAAGLLLIASLGGLAALRRRRKS